MNDLWVRLLSRGGRLSLRHTWVVTLKTQNNHNFNNGNNNKKFKSLYNTTRNTKCYVIGKYYTTSTITVDIQSVDERIPKLASRYSFIQKKLF